MSPRNHTEYQDLLEKHVSGEPISPMDRMVLFDHLEDCDDCRQILEAESRITERMKSVPRLVTPVDLRAKILSQAVRDHRERTTTPSEDPTIADLLKTRAGTDDTVKPAPSSSPAPAEHKSAPPIFIRPSQQDEMPVFAGIPTPRPGRFRHAWQKASPVLATAFLICASIIALYAGQFQGIPVVGDAQQLVWALVNDALRESDSLMPQFDNDDPSPIIIVSANSNDNSSPLTAATIAASAPPPPAEESVINQSSNDSPLSGTATVVDWMHRLRAIGAAADSTVAALSLAASAPVPAPAEASRPRIAALVLRATDKDGETGGFRNSALAQALEDVARTQPGGRIASQDQFALDGNRYRLYTLDLPAGCTDRMVQTLTPYQAPADVLVVNALATQGHSEIQPVGNVQFYSSNETRLRSALQAIVPIGTPGPREQIRIVVVD